METVTDADIEALYTRAPDEAENPPDEATNPNASPNASGLIRSYQRV
jgi:hypothetical protein